MSITTTNYANYTNLINTCHSRKNVLSMCKVNRSAQQIIREIREILHTLFIFSGVQASIARNVVEKRICVLQKLELTIKEKI